MKYLPGQEVKESDYAKLLEAIDKLIWDAVYKPVVDLVRPAMPKVLRPEIAEKELTTSTPKELRNAGDAALKKALQDGAVQVVPGPKAGVVLFIVAKPARAISDSLRAFGAELDKRTGNWTCAKAKVPAWVRLEAEGYAAKARATHEAVKKLITDLKSKVDAIIDRANLAKAADHAISEVAGGWKEQAKALEVKPDLGPEGQQALAAAFERSRGIQIKSTGTKVDMVDALDQVTKREVKVWAAEALERLRNQVDENAEQGYRAEGLARRIRDEYGVSKGRADLIARQETSNFMVAHTAARAADAGLKRYQWYCVRDAVTRKDHLKLHGKIFRFDSPPITDSRTGARNNPGCDWRCRCLARIVIE